ncbi:MAG: glycosyltransferase, partial [bacterium]
IPIAITPMQTGGGVKNKTLEAFALKRLVISSGKGVEALDAQDGVHYIRAERPEEYAREIMRHLQPTDRGDTIRRNARQLVLEKYTWKKIGDRYLGLVMQALTSQERRIFPLWHRT